jgi:hypothetical protein
MSDFFKAEMVRGDLQELSDLQQYCMRAATAFPVLSLEKKIEYCNMLEQLIEKQKIFYTRICLSDDPEAIEVAENMKTATVTMLGLDPGKNVSTVFDDILERVRVMKQTLEAQEG